MPNLGRYRFLRLASISKQTPGAGLWVTWQCSAHQAGQEAYRAGVAVDADAAVDDSFAFELSCCAFDERLIDTENSGDGALAAEAGGFENSSHYEVRGLTPRDRARLDDCVGPSMLHGVPD